ncbi:MAG: dipicolinate synthase subunit B, partial [Clostridia bacterium]|nr:dipicolinate synthase subunit B [Clostridia bacterium]
MNNITAGFAFTGSYCTFSKSLSALENLMKTGMNIIPIFSDNSSKTDSRFGKSKDFICMAESITGNTAIKAIPEAEPIGPKKLLDILIIAPCTGNTIAKLANGITDSPVLMAAKAHMRNEKPLLISISTKI